MIQRIDHVAIAVRDYAKAHRFFTELFGAIPGLNSIDNNLKYRWQLYSVGDLSRFEILNPDEEGSFLDNFLKTREGGVHHITLQTNDIKKAAQTLQLKGIPFFGYREYGKIWKELFIHPHSAFGVLIQIAEFKSDDWLSPSLVMPEGKKYEIAKTSKGVAITFAHPGGGRVTIELTAGEAGELAKNIAKAIET